MALGAAMALHPEATLDLMLFKLVSDVLASGMSVTQAIKVEARKGIPQPCQDGRDRRDLARAGGRGA